MSGCITLTFLCGVALSEDDYQRALRSAALREIRITRHDLVVEGHLIRPKKKKHR